VRSLRLQAKHTEAEGGRQALPYTAVPVRTRGDVGAGLEPIAKPAWGLPQGLPAGRDLHPAMNAGFPLRSNFAPKSPDPPCQGFEIASRKEQGAQSQGTPVAGKGSLLLRTTFPYWTFQYQRTIDAAGEG